MAQDTYDTLHCADTRRKDRPQAEIQAVGGAYGHIPLGSRGLSAVAERGT